MRSRPYVAGRHSLDHVNQRHVHCNRKLPITGCMRPTETTFLPVLAGIVPPDIRRESQVARLTKMAMDNPSHLLHDRVSVAVTYANEHEQRLKSRRPFSRHAAHLVANNYDPPKAWNDRIDAGPPFIRSACPPPSPSLPPGADLPRKQWYDSTVFAPAPLASVRPSNFGACKKQHHVHVATRPRPWSTWWLTVSCSSRPGTSLLFAVRTPKRDPGSANCPLNFELWFFDYLVVVWQTLIYILELIYNKHNFMVPGTSIYILSLPYITSFLMKLILIGAYYHFIV